MSALRSLTLAGLCLGPVPPLAGQEAGPLAARDQTLIQELKPRLGLARDDAVKVVGIVPDPLMAGHDARITQYYRGVRVLGGEGILHQSGPRTRAVTDAFGDFWFDGLEGKTGYTVEVAQPGFKPISLKVRTHRDIVLGELFLEKIA